MATVFKPYNENLHKIGLLEQKDAVAIDRELFTTYQYSVDQGLEVSGMSVAQIIADNYPKKAETDKVLICNGPGMNGGDGFVAARHLLAFGLHPVVFCPKRANTPILNRVSNQIAAHGIPVLDALPSPAEISAEYSVVLDCLFGFSFKPPVRKPYDDILRSLVQVTAPIVSVDFPSGWHLEKGPGEVPEDMKLQPEALISLICPKLGSEFFCGKHHFIAVRFVPRELLNKFGLDRPTFPGTKDYVEV